MSIREVMLPLGITFAIQVFVSLAVVVVPVLAPSLAPVVGVPASAVGLFIAIVYGLSLASSGLSSPLIKRFGAIRLSQACLLSAAVGLILITDDSPLAFVLSAIFLGAGYGPVTPASSHILAKTTPSEKMAVVFSLKQTAVPLGGALAGIAIPALSLWHGYRLAAVASAAACVAVAVLVIPARARLDSDRNPAQPLVMKSFAGPVGFTLSDPTLRLLAICSFFFASLQLCLISFLTTHLVLNVGMPLVQAGLMLTVAQIGGAVARIGWGAIADYWHRPLGVLGFVALAMGAGSAATGLLSADWPLALITLVCVAFGATAIGWNGIYLAQVARIAPPGKVADATGGALVFTYSGVLIGPPLFALLSHFTGYPAAFVALAAPAVLCGVLLLLPGRPRRR